MSEMTPADAAASATASEAPPARQAKIRSILTILLVVLLAGGAGWWLYYSLYGQYQQATNNAFIQADAVTVSPKVAGYVAQVLVSDNEQVRAGQPLVRIDPATYQAATEQFRAQIAIANASGEAVKAQISEQEAAVEKARADLASLKSDADFAAREVARYAPLVQSGAETREKLDQLRDQARQTAARVQSAGASVRGAEQRVHVLKAQVQQAEAQAQSAKAQLSSAQTDIDGTLIRSSIAGRIGNKSVRVGQYAQAGTRLMTIIPTGNLYVEANFKETQVGLMRPGQAVSIHVDALPGVELKGSVASVAPGTGAQFSILPPQNATGNFTKVVQRIPVRIAVAVGPETRRLLVAGMSAEVTVDTRSAKDALDKIDEEQRRLSAGQTR